MTPLFPTKPQVRAIQNLSPYAGTPGAEIKSVCFDDGMQIKTAVYPRGQGKPVVLIAGFTGSMGYLHPFAARLNRNGMRVALIQPPGQGEGLVLSTNPNRPDGYEYTIEGFSSMHLGELGRALSADVFAGQPLYLGGHSRAGYIVRFLASGLEYAGLNADGVPVLESTSDSRQKLNDSFCGFLSLLSPIKAPEDLVKGAQNMAVTMQKMEGMQHELEALKQENSARNDALYLLSDLFIPGHRALRKSLEQKIYDSFEQYSARGFIEYLKGTEPVNYRLLHQARSNARLKHYIPSDLEIEAGLALQRSMMARDPAIRCRISTEEMMHVTRFWVGRTVAAALQEMRDMSADGSWKTQGLATNNQSITFLRAAVLARKEGLAPPLDLLHAEGDGGVDGHLREAALDPRSRQMVLEGGGHGGSLYDPVFAEQMVAFIRKRVSN